METINKLFFLLKRPSVVLVTGKGCFSASEAIFQILKEEFKSQKISGFRVPWTRSRKEVIVLSNPQIEEEKTVKFLLKNSKKPILVLTHIGDIIPEKESFEGEEKGTRHLKETASVVKEEGGVVLNFDDGAIKGIKESIKSRVLAFGFQKRSDVRASDINLDLQGTNFKVSYQNYVIPLWLKRAFGKEQIYAALAAVSVALLQGINLVRASQLLKEHKPLPGKMKMIKGIKGSWIIDDTAASFSSAKEAIVVFSKIGEGNRKIAVLGDVLRTKEDPASFHEELGRRAAKSCDLLFAVGSRGKFLAKGALEAGMENVRHFYNADQAKKEIQKEMKEGDLVLISSSEETPMENILEEIRFIKP